MLTKHISCDPLSKDAPNSQFK